MLRLQLNQTKSNFKILIICLFPLLFLFIGFTGKAYSQLGNGINIFLFSRVKFNAERNPRKGKYPELSFKEEEKHSGKNQNINLNSSGEVLKKKIGSEYENIIDVNYKAGYLREIEELYSTNSFYQSLKFIKRFSDVFQLTLSPSVDYAVRKEAGLPDIYKWYDNTALKADIDFNPYNTLSVFLSGSISDSTWTAYGTSLRSVIETDEVQIRNNFIASYEYFYYWTQVGQDFVNDNVNFKFSNFSFTAGYYFGVVNYNYIENYTALARNPNTSVNLELQYQVYIKPDISVGVHYNTRNFKYRSPLYYSPQDRNIKGADASFYDMFGKYYLYLGAGANVDNNDTFFWNGDFEFGYDNDDISVSLGLGRYNDPYYGNYNSFLNFYKRF